MTQEIIKPRKVEITPGAITILWADGRACTYAHRYLRLQCRCAGCVGEWPNRGELDPGKVPEDVQALDHMAIGSYALQFLWSDAHYTGIYPYTLLRELCP
jgi:DUF971 family protein